MPTFDFSRQDLMALDARGKVVSLRSIEGDDVAYVEGRPTPAALRRVEIEVELPRSTFSHR